MDNEANSEIVPTPEPSQAPTTGDTTQPEAPVAFTPQGPTPAPSTSPVPALQCVRPRIAPVVDWIDLSWLRIGRDFRTKICSETVLPTVPVYRARCGEAFIVRPGIDWTVRTWGVETEEGEFHLVVLPALWSHLRPVLLNVDLFTVMNQKRTVALWPVPRSRASRSIQGVNNAMEVAISAAGEWISLWPDEMGNAGAVYDEPDEPAPEWPAATFEELLNAAFRDRVIGDLEHPVLQSIGR